MFVTHNKYFTFDAPSSSSSELAELGSSSSGAGTIILWRGVDEALPAWIIHNKIWRVWSFYLQFMLAFQDLAMNKVDKLAKQSGFFKIRYPEYGMQDIRLQKRRISDQICSYR